MVKKANRCSFRKLRSASYASTLAKFFFLSLTFSSFMLLFTSLVGFLPIITLNSAITICNTHVLFCAALILFDFRCFCWEFWGERRPWTLPMVFFFFWILSLSLSLCDFQVVCLFFFFSGFRKKWENELNLANIEGWVWNLYFCWFFWV